MSRIKEGLYAIWLKGEGLYVLLALLAFTIFFVPSLITDGIISEIFVESIFLVILVLGAFVIPTHRLLKLGTFFFAFLAILFRFLHKLDKANVNIAVLDNIFAVITLVIFSLFLTIRFLNIKTALTYRIAAAVALYLVLGLIFARCFEIAYLINDKSFVIEKNPTRFSLLYFSFVTLLTIGYGDILPVSPFARSLSILEGVVGQLYLVILISSLVSEFAALKLKQAKEECGE